MGIGGQSGRKIRNQGELQPPPGGSGPDYSVKSPHMNDRRELQQRTGFLLIVLIFVFGLGTAGYMVIEGWSAFDSFYMTAITLTTVGFGEVRTLSDGGRIFTVVLLAIGIGGVAYSFSIITQYLFSVSFSRMTREQRMAREIEHLRDHYIICGFGRVGQNAAEILREAPRDVVVIDNDTTAIELLREHKLHLYYLQGDATDDDVLLQAGLTRARGLLVCTGDDANNLFVVISARALQPDLLIISRSSMPQNEAKMRRAGANKVISPYSIGGQRMANFALRPDLSEMLEVVTTNSGLELWLEDITVGPGSQVAGKTLREVEVRGKTGVTVVVLNRRGQNVMAPGADSRLEVGDHLVVIGTREQVANLERMVNGER